MKIVAVIPAHLASVRFPEKILFQFFGLPMIEHVRRRALLVPSISEVIVATCDERIKDAVESYGGRVIMTSNTHRNGTTRVAEAISDIDCSHVILLQGDEPLLIPDHIESLANSIKAHPDSNAWNATGPIEHEEELDRHSFVKCAVTEENRILYCFRRSPGYSDFELQQKYIRKILGIIAYKKEFLLNLAKQPATTIESAEFIEQMRILENGHSIISVPVEPSLPSVNEPEEADIVLDYIKQHKYQEELLEKTLK